MIENNFRIILEYLYNLRNNKNLFLKEIKPHLKTINTLTKTFPKTIDTQKHIYALLNNNPCKCLCGKIHGNPYKETCSASCYAKQQQKLDAIIWLGRNY